MESQPSAPGHAWTCDTAWKRTADAEHDACTANVAGAVLIARHPEGHPLHGSPCGILILRIAGQGKGHYVWYN